MAEVIFYLFLKEVVKSRLEKAYINNPGRRIDLLEREVEKLENYLSRRESLGFRIS
jgi:hypothetical protein